VVRYRTRLDDALASFERAVALKPDYAGAWANRGYVLSELRRPEEAVVSHSKALAIKPDIEFQFGHYLHAKMKVCD